MSIFQRAGEVVGSGLDKPEPETLGHRIITGIRSIINESGIADQPIPDQKPIAIDAGLIKEASRVIQKLKRADRSLVTAESCTAGFIAAVLAQTEGASDVLQGGFVTYTKENKVAELGVSARLLEVHTSVNAAVVEEMAAGALSRSAASVALAVSGVLGPTPDEDGNPVGLVYLCCRCRSGKSSCLRRSFGEQRHEALMRSTVIEGLKMLEAFVDDLQGTAKI